MDELSIDELVKTIFDQEELIDELLDLAEAGGEIGDEMPDRVDEARDRAGLLIGDLDGVEFQISDDPDDRAEQQLLLSEMKAIGKRVQLCRYYPDVVRYLRLQREAVFAALNDTYGDLTSYVIEFSDDEVAQLEVLLRRAAVDSDEREVWAQLIDSAVQVAKIYFRVAARMTA